MAVLLPLMMLLLMALVQVGVWFHTRAVMTTAAHKALDAARAADGTNADGQHAAEDFLTNAVALRDPAIDVNRGAETATVSISGQVVSVMFGAPVGITVSVDAPVERQAP